MGAIFLKSPSQYAPNVVVGFVRLGGRSVGVIANQLTPRGRVGRQQLCKGGPLFASVMPSTSRSG